MSLLAQLSSDLQTLVRRAATSVVSVEHRRGQGTGVALTGDGYVVTNAHVVRHAREVRVRVSGGEPRRVDVVGSDTRTDLAVLRVREGGSDYLGLAREPVEVGQIVVAIGNPFQFDRSVSLGVVSALDRSLPGEDGPMEGLVQTDAAVNPGNSGGPLLDVHGAVVGITTAMLPYAQGMGFAVPADTVEWVTAVLIEDGIVVRPILGIQASSEALHPALADDLAQTRAVRIHSISPGTPADRAGLRSGDLLVRAARSAVRTVNDLQRAMVLAAEPDLDLEVVRDRARHRLRARLVRTV